MTYLYEIEHAFNISDSSEILDSGRSRAASCECRSKRQGGLPERSPDKGKLSTTIGEDIYWDLILEQDVCSYL